MNRREVLKGGAALSAAAMLGRAPALIAAERARPIMPHGVMSGDLLGDRAIIWAAADRPARMLVEWSRDPAFSRLTRRQGPVATAASNFTAKLDLAGLPAGEEIHYRIAFQDADTGRAASAWTTGRLRLPGGTARPLRFTYSADECGQGYGINPDLGGYRIYEAMRRKKPDFFIHQGDQIYADNPLQETMALPGGGTWRNILTPAKTRVAASLADFRGAFAYNLLDDNKRRFLSEVPMLSQWDDHELTNNWQIDKPVAAGPSLAQLAAWARQATLDYNPMRISADAPGLNRLFRFGPLLDIFMLDARSLRGPNGPAAGVAPGKGLYGAAQIDWLKHSLKASKATWKLIAGEMPLSLIVADRLPDGTMGVDAMANGKPGPPGGREAELADLLAFVRAQGIANIVWICADVHFSAAIRYHPDRATFGNFTPFWEFVAGPMNAGSFPPGPNALDPTFGPEMVYSAIPVGRTGDNSPRAGLQFFGMGEIDPQTRVLTMSINDLDGKELRRFPLEPAL